MVTPRSLGFVAPVIHTLGFGTEDGREWTVELFADRAVFVCERGIIPPHELEIPNDVLPHLIDVLCIMRDFVPSPAPPVPAEPTRIVVAPEGRDEVWLPGVDSLIDWIREQGFEAIHNFMPGGPIMLGADHEVESVIGSIKTAEKVAILTGEARVGNLNHALACIQPTKDGRGELEIYDIGDVDPAIHFHIQEPT